MRIICFPQLQALQVWHRAIISQKEHTEQGGAPSTLAKLVTIPRSTAR